MPTVKARHCIRAISGNSLTEEGIIYSARPMSPIKKIVCSSLNGRGAQVASTESVNFAKGSVVKGYN
jgi:hypothetical protein